MNKEIRTFSDNKIEKRKLHCYKNCFLGIVDIDNILISGKVYSGEKNYKYFIGYTDNNYKIKPFSIIFPKISTYVKH